MLLKKSFKVFLFCGLSVVIFASCLIFLSVNRPGTPDQKKIVQQIEILREKIKALRAINLYDPEKRLQAQQLYKEISAIQEELIKAGKRAVPELIKSISIDTAEYITQILVEIGEAAIQPVIKELNRTKSEKLKINLIYTLGAIAEEQEKKDKRIISTLKKYIDNKNPEIRRTAITALGYCGEEAVEPLCEQLFKEEDEEIKQDILSSLAEIKSVSALPYLEKALEKRIFFGLLDEIVDTMSEITDKPINKLAADLYSQGKITREGLRKCKEWATKSGLAALRSALSIYYAENDGIYPTGDIENALVPVYLDAIPEADTGIEGFPVTNKVKYGKEVDNTGGWLYNNDKNDPMWGEIRVNCKENDSKGVPWSSY